MSFVLRAAIILSLCLASLSNKAHAQALQTFTVTDYIGHTWNEELVTFDFDVATTGAIRLTDAAGNTVPAQFANVTVAGGHTTGQVMTVIDQLAADANTVRQIRSGTQTTTSDLGWLNDTTNNWFVFWNDRVTIRIPRFTGGTLPTPVALTSLPVPIVGVRNTGGGATGSGTWLTGGSWFNNGTTLMVKSTTVNAYEVGPIRHRFRVVYVFTDDTAYTFEIQLGSKQDVATVVEISSMTNPPDAGWRFSMQPGLNANHVFFQDQNGGSELMKDVTVSFASENLVATLRPWSFWWNTNMANWAGFYNASASNFFGVIMRKPSLWAPNGDESKFQSTEIPITARTSGAVDLTLRLKAGLQRHWGFLAKQTTSGYVQSPGYVTGPANVSKLRLDLVKYSEFPLNEVKDFNFDFTWTHAARSKPFLIMNSSDVTRVRNQYAADEPVVKQQVTWSKYYTDSVGPYTYYQSVLQQSGREAASKAFFDNRYEVNDLRGPLVDVYLGTTNTQYEELLAAAVRAMGKYYLQVFVEAPSRASIGANAHTMNSYLVEALLNFDLVADSSFMTTAEKTKCRNILLFLAHLSAHADYWNPPKGLASGNPNMTLMAILPRGVFGTYFAGHPKAAGWVSEARSTFEYQLVDLTAPASGALQGGAWYESPGYQMVAMSDMLMLATALRKANNDNDYFENVTFKEALWYLASLTTPSDIRFPTNNQIYRMQTQYMTGIDAPSVMPSIGDTFSGQIYSEFGWIAAQTADLDASFSARMQYIWLLGNYQINTMGLHRGRGFMLALTDTSLDVEVASELAAGYYKFGNVMRSSWWDPKASYVCHRTTGHERVAGPNNSSSHWQDEENSFVYYAKGAPLSVDFGSFGIRNAWQHNAVSFELTGPSIGLAGSTVPNAIATLPHTLDYSYGRSEGASGQVADRHLLMIKSEDAEGANYLVIRDKTVDGVTGQNFYFNFWALASARQVTGNTVNFTGQNGVDLDLHFLAPASPTITTDSLSWSAWIFPWGTFEEEQLGVHARKTGSTEDFFTVLYPRGDSQGAATLTSLASNKAVRVVHMEGTDWVLLSPGSATALSDGSVSMNAEIGFARVGSSNFRLAVSAGGGSAAYGAWQVSSTGPTAAEIGSAGEVVGEVSGAARNVTLRAPSGYTATVSVDGDVVSHTLGSSGGNVTYTFAVPAGVHTFTVDPV